MNRLSSADVKKDGLNVEQIEDLGMRRLIRNERLRRSAGAWTQVCCI